MRDETCFMLLKIFESLGIVSSIQNHKIIITENFSKIFKEYFCNNDETKLIESRYVQSSILEDLHEIVDQSNVFISEVKEIERLNRIRNNKELQEFIKVVRATNLIKE